MPSRTVKRLNWTSTRKPSSDSATMNPLAAATLTWPEGIGRLRVRATPAS